MKHFRLLSAVLLLIAASIYAADEIPAFDAADYLNKNQRYVSGDGKGISASVRYDNSTGKFLGSVYKSGSNVRRNIQIHMYLGRLFSNGQGYFFPTKYELTPCFDFGDHAIEQYDIDVPITEFYNLSWEVWHPVLTIGEC